MTLQACPFCDRPSDDEGRITHRADCDGLQDAQMNKLQERILRDELSTALLKLHQLSEDHSHCEGLLHEIGERASRAEGRLGRIRELTEAWSTDDSADRLQDVLKLVALEAWTDQAAVVERQNTK